jgi:hypothetical protein
MSSIGIIPMAGYALVQEKAMEESQENSAVNMVKERLLKEFDISEDFMDHLHDQNLEYGEIRQVLLFAKQMPGGITDQNVEKIVKAHQGENGRPKEWWKVANELGVHLIPS